MSKSRERFKQLAENRTNKILKYLDLLGNLSNRSNYSYEDADVKKIFFALNKKLKDVRGKFKSSSNNDNDEEFRL